MQEFLEASDAARLLNVSYSTLRCYIRDGRLPVAATTVRGVRLFEGGAVEALRALREARPTRTADR